MAPTVTVSPALASKYFALTETGLDSVMPCYSNIGEIASVRRLCFVWVGYGAATGCVMVGSQ